MDGRDLALIGFVYLQEIKAVSEQAGNTQGSQCVVGATEQAERGGEAEGEVGQSGRSEPGTMS